MNIKQKLPMIKQCPIKIKNKNKKMQDIKYVAFAETLLSSNVK